MSRQRTRTEDICVNEFNACKRILGDLFYKVEDISRDGADFYFTVSHPREQEIQNLQTPEEQANYVARKLRAWVQSVDKTTIMCISFKTSTVICNIHINNEDWGQ